MISSGALPSRPLSFPLQRQFPLSPTRWGSITAEDADLLKCDRLLIEPSAQTGAAGPRLQLEPGVGG